MSSDGIDTTRLYFRLKDLNCSEIKLLLPRLNILPSDCKATVNGNIFAAISTPKDFENFGLTSTLYQVAAFGQLTEWKESGVPCSAILPQVTASRQSSLSTHFSSSSSSLQQHTTNTNINNNSTSNKHSQDSVVSGGDDDEAQDEVRSQTSVNSLHRIIKTLRKKVAELTSANQTLTSEKESLKIIVDDLTYQLTTAKHASWVQNSEISRLESELIEARQINNPAILHMSFQRADEVSEGTEAEAVETAAVGGNRQITGSNSSSNQASLAEDASVTQYGPRKMRKPTTAAVSNTNPHTSVTKPRTTPTVDNGSSNSNNSNNASSSSVHVRAAAVTSRVPSAHQVSAVLQGVPVYHRPATTIGIGASAAAGAAAVAVVAPGVVPNISSTQQQPAPAVPSDATMPPLSEQTQQLRLVAKPSAAAASKRSTGRNNSNNKNTTTTAASQQPSPAPAKVVLSAGKAFQIISGSPDGSTVGSSSNNSSSSNANNTSGGNLVADTNHTIGGDYCGNDDVGDQEYHQDGEHDHDHDQQGQMKDGDEQGSEQYLEEVFRAALNNINNKQSAALPTGRFVPQNSITTTQTTSTHASATAATSAEPNNKPPLHTKSNKRQNNNTNKVVDDLDDSIIIVPSAPAAAISALSGGTTAMTKPPSAAAAGAAAVTKKRSRPVSSSNSNSSSKATTTGSVATLPVVSAASTAAGSSKRAKTKAFADHKVVIVLDDADDDDDTYSHAESKCSGGNSSQLSSSSSSGSSSSSNNNKPKGSKAGSNKGNKGSKSSSSDARVVTTKEEESSRLFTRLKESALIIGNHAQSTAAQLQAVNVFHKVFADNDPTDVPMPEILSCGVAPRLVAVIQSRGVLTPDKRLLHACMVCLNDIIARTESPSDVDALVALDIIGVMKRHLVEVTAGAAAALEGGGAAAADFKAQEQAVWTLENVAIDRPDHQATMVDSGIVQAIFGVLLQPSVPAFVLLVATRALNCLFEPPHSNALTALTFASIDQIHRAIAECLRATAVKAGSTTKEIRERVLGQTCELLCKTLAVIVPITNSNEQPQPQQQQRQQINAHSSTAAESRGRNSRGGGGGYNDDGDDDEQDDRAMRYHCVVAIVHSKGTQELVQLLSSDGLFSPRGLSVTAGGRLLEALAAVLSVIHDRSEIERMVVQLETVTVLGRLLPKEFSLVKHKKLIPVFATVCTCFNYIAHFAATSGVIVESFMSSQKGTLVRHLILFTEHARGDAVEQGIIRVQSAYTVMHVLRAANVDQACVWVEHGVLSALCSLLVTHERERLDSSSNSSGRNTGSSSGSSNSSNSGTSSGKLQIPGSMAVKVLRTLQHLVSVGALTASDVADAVFSAVEAVNVTRTGTIGTAGKGGAAPEGCVVLLEGCVAVDNDCVDESERGELRVIAESFGLGLV